MLNCSMLIRGRGALQHAKYKCTIQLGKFMTRSMASSYTNGFLDDLRLNPSDFTSSYDSSTVLVNPFPPSKATESCRQKDLREKENQNQYKTCSSFSHRFPSFSPRLLDFFTPSYIHHHI